MNLDGFKKGERYIMPGDNLQEVRSKYNGQNMQQVYSTTEIK